MTQFAYTSETWAAHTRNLEDRSEAFGQLAQTMGGSPPRGNLFSVYCDKVRDAFGDGRVVEGVAGLLQIVRIAITVAGATLTLTLVGRAYIAVARPRELCYSPDPDAKGRNRRLLRAAEA
jgi:hypothetical protein